MTPSVRKAAGRWMIAGCALMTLAGCASGSLSAPDTSGPATSPPASSTPVSTAVSITGPTVIVTVPDLVLTSAPAVEAAPSPAPAESAPSEPSVDAEPAPVEQAVPTETPEPPAEAPAPVEPAPTPEPAPPAGEGINVSLENCDGCTVLATHRGVTGELSGALVGTGSGRAILLSVRPDGSVAGVIGVPYGAAFSAADGGVLACAQGRCVVQGRQADGRAILSAFELTDSGAWRDVSGDDAFPSATERAAVIDLGGELGIAVQDQGSGEAVWILYRWSGDRFVVVGCAADGSPPSSLGAVTPGQCLS